MKILFAFLLCCNAVCGQTLLFPKDSSLKKMIDDLPSREPFDTAQAYKRVAGLFVYLISDNDVYSLFGYKTGVKYSEFNFADYHIFGTYQCRQCLQNCHHDEGQTSCHRNRCNNVWIWLMRENKKAFTEIPSTTFPGHVGALLPAGRESFFGDTIIKSTTDTIKTRWYTTGHGDCMAHFNYALLADKYHPVLLLKEWNFYGGCRAAGSKDYTISFTMPPGILHHTKNTILVKKYSD